MDSMDLMYVSFFVNWHKNALVSFPSQYWLYCSLRILSWMYCLLNMCRNIYTHSRLQNCSVVSLAYRILFSRSNAAFMNIHELTKSFIIVLLKNESHSIVKLLVSEAWAFSRICTVHFVPNSTWRERLVIQVIMATWVAAMGWWEWLGYHLVCMRKHAEILIKVTKRQMTQHLQ